MQNMSKFPSLQPAALRHTAKMTPKNPQDRIPEPHSGARLKHHVPPVKAKTCSCSRHRGGGGTTCWGGFGLWEVTASSGSTALLNGIKFWMLLTTSTGLQRWGLPAHATLPEPGVLGQSQSPGTARAGGLQQTGDTHLHRTAATHGQGPSRKPRRHGGPGTKEGEPAWF